jgi:hypothetical protein
MPKLVIKPGFPRVLSNIILNPITPSPPMPVSRNYIANSRNDGIGSQLHAKISTMLYAKRNNMTYVHAPFVRCRRHPDPDPVVAEKFFNLGHGELKISDVKDVKVVSDYKFFSKNPNAYLEILGLIKARYRMSEKHCFYNRNVVNVAFHVRRGDVKGGRRFTSNKDILKIYNKIINLLPDAKFHLFSEGLFDDFREFSDIELHLNEDALTTFHHLVMANILVMAKSSFSYSAALYSDGIKIYDPNPKNYLPMNGWIIKDESFDEVISKIQ